MRKRAERTRDFFCALIAAPDQTARSGRGLVRNRERIGGYVLTTLRTWVIALFLFGTLPAFAANPNPMSESRARQLQGDLVPMWNTVVNFSKMGRAGEGQEAKGLLLISGLGTTSLTSVSFFLDLAIIYQRMTCENDKAYVAGHASTVLQGAKRILDAQRVNAQMKYLKSPAAIAEAERLSDFLQQLRQELDQYHY